MIRIKNSLRGSASVCLVSLLGVGCYTTTIHSGKPANHATVAYDQRWHHGLFAGVAELSEPYDLSEVCPQGWAEVETEQSFLTGLLGMISDFYSPQLVTIRCAAAAPLTAAAPSPWRPGDVPAVAR
ncbi:MAG: Bor protein [Pseudomonadota bacterium]